MKAHTNPHKDEPQYFNSKVRQLPTSTSSTIEIIRYALRGSELIFKPGFNDKKARVMILEIIPENQVKSGFLTRISGKWTPKL